MDAIQPSADEALITVTQITVTIHTHNDENLKSDLIAFLLFVVAAHLAYFHRTDEYIAVSIVTAIVTVSISVMIARRVPATQPVVDLIALLIRGTINLMLFVIGSLIKTLYFMWKVTLKTAAFYRQNGVKLLFLIAPAIILYGSSLCLTNLSARLLASLHIHYDNSDAVLAVICPVSHLLHYYLFLLVIKSALATDPLIGCANPLVLTAQSSVLFTARRNFTPSVFVPGSNAVVVVEHGVWVWVSVVMRMHATFLVREWDL